jgi:cytochrome c553
MTWRRARWGVLAVIVVIVFVMSGVISIKASARHWAATAWVLDLVKRRSVATHSLGAAVPPLDDPALVLKGAGHYELGCRPCHGSPGSRPPVIPLRMTTHPPDLKAQVDRWKPRELFYIVKHGIKFTGMSAWPAAGRDDEVWAMVAFLRVLPRLDAAQYQALAMTGRQPSDSFAMQYCAQCHGVDGNGRGLGAFPRLAGQQIDYQIRALKAYRDGARHSGTMAAIAGDLSDARIEELARHFGAMRRTTANGSSPYAEGERIATRGIPEREVPACIECHGPAGGPRNPAYPDLAGQYPEYLRLQLQLFAENRRGGSAFAHLMQPIATRLTEEERRQVARYFASVTSDRRPF